MRDAFLINDAGQDLIEYTLLLAFICLVGAGFYIGVGQNVNAIWSIVNTRLASAASSGSGS